MRCRVLNCRENENGYCSCSSYVQIDETGSCSEMFISEMFIANNGEENVNERPE